MTSYTDNIKVKISEKYKPPPRINLAVTYAQRLKLNKQIQDNIPNYNFSMENCIIEKMNEWREKKSLFLKQRQSNVELKRQKLEEAKKRNTENTDATSATESPTTSTFAVNSSLAVEMSRSDPPDMKYTISNNSMLIPTQVSNNYSTILKPTQLQSYGKQLGCKEIDKKSSFNFSDFENDTSSPFDNMELKSINDLEQLAQVLNQEDDQKLKTKASSYLQSNVQNVQTDESQPPQQNYSNFLWSGYSGNQYFSNIPCTLSSFTPNSENFVYSNGYKYPTEFTQVNQQYAPYNWAKLNNEFTGIQLAGVDTKKSNCKSVPDLVNALEIENSYVSDSSYKTSERNKSNVQEIRPKSVDDVSTFHKKVPNQEALLNFLTKDEQEFCKSISIMGFPIDRVAKVYKLIGNDQKKIVEHLLAMSELLDLGFQEKDISNALLECDNDRDKALDKLIS